MTALSYTSSSEVAVYIPQLTSDPSTAINDLLQLLTARVSRQIDNITKRRFYSSTATEVKIFNGNGSCRLLTPLDIASSSGLVLQIAFDTVAASSGTFTTIDAKDYNLIPDQVRDGWPKFGIELTDVPVGSYSTSYSYTSFPEGRNTVKVTAYWGWSSTAAGTTGNGAPDDIRNAATELVVRAWRGKDMNFNDTIGVEGLGNATFSRRMPADIADVLETYTRDNVG